MNIQLSGIAAAVGIGLTLLATNALAQNDEAVFRLTTGVDYTSGDYGGDVDIEDVYVPVTATVDYGRIGFRLTVPYLSVRAPAGTIFTDPGGQPVPGSGERNTESGLGDIVGSVTLYDLVYSRDTGFALDVTGKVKFATANEDKGLGTGEADYSLQADLYKYFDEFTIFGSAGYKVRGDPDGVDLENTFFGSVGGMYQFTPVTRGGLVLGYRESSFAENDSIRELTGFVSRRINDDWRIQLYALTGFSDSSPDTGGGVMMKRAF